MVVPGEQPGERSRVAPLLHPAPIVAPMGDRDTEPPQHPLGSLLVRDGMLLSVAALLVGCGVLTAQAPEAPLLPVPVSASFSSPVAPGEPSGGSPPSPGRVWVRGEYLLWWIKNGPVPPLVTASPADSAGIL